jgi:predicted ATPase
MESAHQQRMLLLHQANRRSDALQQYKLCAAILQHEFGAEPTAETTAVYERLRQQNIPANLDAPASAPTNLPRLLTPIIGREAEMASLAEKLTHPDYPLVTIQGTAGVGKTHLAIALGLRLRPHFPDGVWLVDLSDIPAPPDKTGQTLLMAIARTLACKTENLSEKIGGKKMLLILDNMEHLQAQAPLLLPLLQASPNLKILAASQTRLQLRAEVSHYLLGLSWPGGAAEADPQELLAYESVQLFVERAQRSAPSFQLEADNGAAVAALCAYLEGSPLAIELAAQLLPQKSAPQILSLLQEDIFALQSELADMPPRHRSLDNLMQSVWNQLLVAEALLLARCTIFPGSFTPEAAAAIIDASPAQLAGLHQRSLLYSLTPHRYQTHSLIRRFAEGKRPIADPGQKIELQFCRYYSDFLAQRAKRLDREQAVYQEIGQEMGNIRAAWQLAAALAYRPMLKEAAYPLTLYLASQGLFTESAELLATAVACARRQAKTNPVWQQTVGRLLFHLTYCQQRLGQIETALSSIQESSRIADQLADRWLQERVANLMSSLAYFTGRMAEGHAYAKRAVAIAKEEGWVEEQSRALISLSAFTSYITPDEYLAINKEALHLATQAQNKRLMSVIATNTASSLLKSDRFYEARSYYEIALNIRRQLGDQVGVALILSGLTRVRAVLGDWGPALSQIQEAFALLKQMSDRPYQASALNLYGWTLALSGDAAGGVRLCQQARELTLELGLAYQQREIDLHLAHIFLIQGQLHAAERHYRQAIAQEAAEWEQAISLMAQAGIVEVAARLETPEAALPELEALLAKLPHLTGYWTYEPLRAFQAGINALRIMGERDQAAELARLGGARVQAALAGLPELTLRQAFLRQAQRLAPAVHANYTANKRGAEAIKRPLTISPSDSSTKKPGQSQ